MSSFGTTTFRGMPILCWAMDDFPVVEKACKEASKDLYNVVENYRDRVYNPRILPLFNDGRFKLNLGGDTIKTRIINTDRPTGVFNFALASQSLYALTEYFSEDLKRDNPTRFSGLGLLSGLVPPDYKEGIPFAKKQFASKNKKVYQAYKRRGGRVRYVEIYSLFYYTSVSGDVQYAIRHIPALMVAEYLESIGIKTRIYMTRYVVLGSCTLKEKTADGFPLPMSKITGTRFSSTLCILPIITKEFLQSTDNAFALAVSASSTEEDIYAPCCRYAMRKELTSTMSVYGEPNWQKSQYWEGIERFRGKYQQYVDDGLFKTKEVLPESMIFFHDMSIKNNLRDFMSEIVRMYVSRTSKSYSETEVLLVNDVNRFFAWWMKTSANVIKHKINMLNSVAYEKDMLEIYNDLIQSKEELDMIIVDTKNKDESDLYKKTGHNIMYDLSIYLSAKFRIGTEFTYTAKVKVIIRGFSNYKTVIVPCIVYDIRFGRVYYEFTEEDSSGRKTKGKSDISIVDAERRVTNGDWNITKDGVSMVSLDNYINNFTEELTTYAEGDFYPSTDDEQDKRNDFKLNMNRQVKKVKESL